MHTFIRLSRNQRDTAALKQSSKKRRRRKEPRYKLVSISHQTASFYDYGNKTNNKMSKVEIKQELGTLFLMTLSGATLHGDYNGLTLGDEKELYPDF